MEDRRLLQIGIAVAVVLILFLIWWLWPPTAKPDTASIGPNSQSVAINVLANDSDLFGRKFFIKDWSKTANRGTITLAPGGAQLIYTLPHDRAPAPDNFTYSIWTRHGFPSTASVTIAIAGLPSAGVVAPTPVPAASTPVASDCPRGEAHSLNPKTPFPKQYGDCFAIYFSWKNGSILDEHKRATKSILVRIAKEAAGKTLIVAGYTDTSGVHYKELSKSRACSAVAALKSLGPSAAAIEALAKGRDDPAVVTAGDVKDRLNRRVEIRLLARAPQANADAVECDR